MTCTNPLSSLTLRTPGCTILKVRFTQDLPEEFSEITSEALTMLRLSLDHAVYSVAIAAGNTPKIGDACFPFARNAAHFEASLKGRCAQVPPEMYDLFRRCKPYEGGNEPLWALNVTRGFTHAMLVPGVTTAFIGGMDIRGMGWISMPLKPVMDSKHEMELCTLAPQAAVQGKYQLAVYVAFGEVGSVAGKNVGEVLELFIKLVETIVNEIEAETRRLGFIK